MRIIDFQDFAYLEFLYFLKQKQFFKVDYVFRFVGSSVSTDSPLCVNSHSKTIDRRPNF